MRGQKRKDAQAAAGTAILKEIDRFLSKGQTPVKGGEYTKFMADGKSISDLFDEGDMRAHTTWDNHSSGVKIGVFSDAPNIERLKASGHNKGDSANGVKREFIPTPKSEFKKTIMDKARKAIKEVSGSSLSALDIRDGN